MNKVHKRFVLNGEVGFGVVGFKATFKTQCDLADRAPESRYLAFVLPLSSRLSILFGLRGADSADTSSVD